MCSVTVVWRPGRWERTWLATRWPRWKSSTVRSVYRAWSWRPTRGVGDGVVVAFELDVIVDVHAHLLPLGEDVSVGRQRAQRRAVDGFEGGAPRAGELAERARIEPFEPLGDGLVELGE